MTWYAASVLFAFDNVHGPQNRWHVWEDVVLIEASSHEEAKSRAQAYAETWTDLGTALKFGGHLAVRRFIGVRKILTISNPAHMDIDQSEHPPVNGTEITFTEFIVESREDLEKLARGERVRLVYDDCVGRVSSPEEFVHALGQRFPQLESIYKEHLNSFGEAVAHVFVDDVACWTISQMELKADNVVERTQKLREVLDAIEDAYADGDEEMREFISASFLEKLATRGTNAGSIVELLGPRLLEELGARAKSGSA